MNIGRGKFSFLDPTPQKKEELKKDNFLNELQEILNKINKND
jgi:hypothetical protein